MATVFATDDSDEEALARFHAAATRAATAASRSPAVRQDILQYILDAYTDHLARSCEATAIRQPQAWAHAVARKALRTILRSQKEPTIDVRDTLTADLHTPTAIVALPGGDSGAATSPTHGPADLRIMLHRLRHRLTVRQQTVVRAVLDHRTYAAAARALGADRTNLRNVFRRALDRLRSPE